MHIQKYYGLNKCIGQNAQSKWDISAELEGVKICWFNRIHLFIFYGFAQVTIGDDEDEDEEYVVGIDFDIEKSVKILTNEKDCVDVLAIVGMGGSGKTTLARNIYNHAKIKKYFKYQAWVSMSPGWVLSDVMSEISRQINDQTGLFDGLSEFLMNGVRRKKSLIVLDNVWDCDRLQDELLPKIIQRDDGGDANDERIKIVITSRHRHEHHTTLKWYFHVMKLLSQEDALDLFNKVRSWLYPILVVLKSGNGKFH